MNDKKQLTNRSQPTNGTPAETSARRTWEPMSLARVGTFGDVLKGNTGTKGDGGFAKARA
jgi:hypothetical protein